MHTRAGVCVCVYTHITCPLYCPHTHGYRGPQVLKPAPCKRRLRRHDAVDSGKVGRRETQTGLMVSVQVRRQERTDVPAQGSPAGGVPSYSREGGPFRSSLAFSCLGKAHPYGGGQSALSSLLIQTSVSSKILSQTYPEECLTNYLGTPDSAKLPHKINPHVKQDVIFEG